MKSLFKKREIPFNCNRHYLLLQKKWADKMSGLTAGGSRRELIFLLILFVAFSAGYLLFNIYESFADGASPIIKKTGEASRISTNY